MSGYNSKKRKSGVTNRGGNSGSSTVPSTSRGTVDWPEGQGFTTESGGTFRPGGNPLNNKYTDLLDRLRGNSEFARLLQSLGLSEEDILSNTQKQDFNKQLVDQLLSYLTTQENRQYNEGLRDEQRLYDNPLNQLARLMGAGISRDAALQILGSGAGGSGAAVPYSDPSAMMQGLSPSESALNEAKANLANLQGKLGIVGAVFGGVDALSGLVNLGFSSAQALQQLTFLKNQNYLTSSQKAAYQSAGTAYRILKTAGLGLDSFKNISSVGESMLKLAEGGDLDAQQFMKSGAYRSMKDNAAFSSAVLNQLYQSERASDDYVTSFESAIGRIQSETHLNNCNSNKLVSEIPLIKEQIDNLRSSTEYNNALTALQAVVERLTGQQVKTEEQRTQQLFLLNRETTAFQDATLNGKTGLELYTDKRLQDIYGDLQLLLKVNTEDAFVKHANSILASYDNAKVIYELGTLYSQGEIDFLQDKENADAVDLLEFCRVADKSGFFPYCDALMRAETSGNVRFGSYGSSTRAERAYDLLKRRGHKRSTVEKILNWKPFGDNE